MIRMKAEAVVITKPDINTNLNGCNINMNGKVLSAEVADKGYKGAGTLSGEVVVCLASGDREAKAAETAMNILSQHIPAIKACGDSFSTEVDSFFNHAFRELSMQNGAYNTFSATLLYNHADKVYVANAGDNAVYTFDGMYLNQIDFADIEPKKKEENLPTTDINCRVIADVKPGTLIVVLNKEIYEYTTDEQILDILRNAVSTKQACQKLIDQATENGAESYTAVMIESLTPTDVPVAGVAPIAPEDRALLPPEETDAQEEDLSKPSKAPLVVLILLLIIVALVAGVYFANQKYDLISKFTAGRTTELETDLSTEPSANMITLPSTTINSLTSTDPSTTATTTTATPTTTKRETQTTRRPSNNSNENNNQEEPTQEERPEPTAAPTDPPSEPTQSPTDPEPSDEPSGEDPDDNELMDDRDDPPAVNVPDRDE